MDNENRQTAELAAYEEKLLERTRQRDDVQLRLVKSDELLTTSRTALQDSITQHRQTDNSLVLKTATLETRDLDLAEKTAHLALAALELSQRTNELHESNRYLLRRTAELEAANAELRAMMQQREDFVAALTHDLKNPLVGCIMLLEFLTDGEIEADQHPQILRQLLDTNKSMHSLMSNLLDVYKKESGSLTPIFETVDVSLLLTQCINEFAFGIEQKKLTTQVKAPLDLPKINSDTVLLRRVLVNLIGNGIKFSPEGGKLIVTAAYDEKHLTISIKDSGPGIAQASFDRLFERFWQTEEGRRSGIGTGLGLYISKQIMLVLGGDISCVTGPQEGTTFTVHLNR